jgi:hypothetical protein
MPWPVVILRDNGWEPCVLESSAPIPTPPYAATFDDRIQHYKSVHSYREIPERERTEKKDDGTSYRVVTMERKLEET